VNTVILKVAAAAVALAGLAAGQSRSADRAYGQAMKALEQREWDRAVEGFTEAARGGARVEGALYWKAYSQNKLGRREEALATIEELRKAHPNSRWLNDAKALEVEVRQAAGRPVTPETEADDDLKLMALNSLVQSDPERVTPILEKLLKGPSSPKLKERALFVLSQSRSEQARAMLVSVARESNPDLQLKAIHYLGIMGGRENRQLLAEVYAGSTDAGVKRAILRSLMASGDRERLVALAKEEKQPELRGEAIRQLGAMGAQAELWDMYGKESVVEVKEQLLNALFIGGNSEKILEVAKTEKEPKLRREAVRRLGMMGVRRTGDVLAELYAGDGDPAVRREVINALFIQGNAKALVEIARKETNPELRKEAVRKLSVMKSKEATDFMLEVLSK